MIVVRENGVVQEQDPRRNIDYAYVLTTHKMQGSRGEACMLCAEQVHAVGAVTT